MNLIAAEIVFASHLAFVVFVFFGGLAFAYREWLIWPHGLSLVYALVSMGGFWFCPLTLLEQWFLERADIPVYVGEFLPHYFWEPLGMTGTEPYLIASVLLTLVAANYVPYRSYFRRDGARRARRITNP
jgi:hypothetical protein